jgi:amino acid permease
MRFVCEKARGGGRCEASTVSQSASGRKRVVRGWITMAIGCGALATPLLIGDWGSLFLLACAPLGMFILVVGMVEVVRGAREADGEGR